MLLLGALCRLETKPCRLLQWALVFTLLCLNFTAVHGASSGNSTETSDPHAAGHRAHAHDALLFMFLTLFFGLMLSFLISRLAPSVPHTVTLYILGMVVGLLRQAAPSSNTLNESIGMWQSMDPHLMLHAFLPALLFGDALNVNKHQAWTCQGACATLATLGVVFGAGLTALVMRFMCPIDFTWNESWTAGSIMAATDPVAVVAILKALGASNKLNMLIAGESLMNDGVAIVVYKIFHEMSLGKFYSYGDMIAFFLKLFCGGIGLGVVFGTVTLAILYVASNKLQHDDHLIQTSAMFCCAYLSFWIAELPSVGVSGVLANVVSALMIGFYGKGSWVDRSGVEHVFHWVEYAGNTLLFMVAGVIVGDLLASDDLQLRGIDWAWLLGLYVLGILIRGLVVLTLFPALSRMGARVKWQEAVVMVWGGLRGAVGLALAVEVAHTSQSLDGHDLSYEEMQRRKHILFQCSMFTTLTLLINAPTTGLVVKKLGLIQEPVAAAVMRLASKKHLAKMTKEFHEKNQDHAAFRGYNSQVMDEVMEVAAAVPPQSKFDEALSKVSPSHLLDFQRNCFLRLVGSNYWRMRDAGIMPVCFDCLQQLLESVECALDFTQDGLKDWEYLHTQFLKGTLWWANFRKKGRLCYVAGQAAYEQTILNAVLFIAGHTMAQQRARDIFPDGESLEALIEESASLVDEAKAWLRERNQNSVERMRTIQFVTAIKEENIHNVHKLKAHGLLTDKEAHDLLHHMDHDVDDVISPYSQLSGSTHPMKFWPGYTDPERSEEKEWNGFD